MLERNICIGGVSVCLSVTRLYWLKADNRRTVGSCDLHWRYVAQELRPIFIPYVAETPNSNPGNPRLKNPPCVHRCHLWIVEAAIFCNDAYMRVRCYWLQTSRRWCWAWSVNAPKFGSKQKYFDTLIHLCVVLCSSWPGDSECSVNHTLCWVTERVKQLWAGTRRRCILAPAGGATVDWVIADECAAAANDVIGLPVSGIHQSHGPCCRNLLWYVFLSRYVCEPHHFFIHKSLCNIGFCCFI